MCKIEYNVYLRDEHNASSKAKDDVSKILFQLGFRKLYNPSKYRIIRIVQQFLSIISIPKGSELFIQYHSNISFFYRLIAKLKNVSKVAIIHDLESLRKNISVEEEVHLLNGFDCIISHNASMTSFLKCHGVNKKIVDLGIFDYLLSNDISIIDDFRVNTIFFAGNLKKSLFLRDLSKFEGLSFNLYGADFDGLSSIKTQKNVFYKGSFSPEDLIANIRGGWGLVWDGDSLDTCSGTTGDYLRYNNPHKVSMCIVSERPVIIWHQAAMAEYIINKGLGVAINSLEELPLLISNFSQADYLQLRENVRNEKKRLVNGCSLKEIIKKINN